VKPIKYTYKFRLNPTPVQEVLLNKHFGSVRWAYNYFLDQRKEEYSKNKKSLNYYTQSAELTKLKRKEETRWLKEVNSQTLQFALSSLENAYQAFFTRRTQFPKFKSKRSKNSFTVPQFTKIKNEKLVIPKFQEGIQMIMERKVRGTIKKATLSKTPSGKYYVSILSEIDYQPVNKTGKSVGIDLGLKDLVVMSDGSKVKNHRFIKHYQKSLTLNQKHLSRKTKGSNRYDRQRLKVARIHEKITNSRIDLIHKISLDLVRRFDVIYLEDLNIKGMVKKGKLARSITDASWGKFIEVLTYKANWNDKEVITIDRFFPSSKTCNSCGWINKNLELKDRSWTCKCGLNHDRDLNAAKNILNEGLRKNISVGTTDHGRGAQIRLEKFSKGYETSKKKILSGSEIHQSLADV
jgi:putative transposase